VTRLALVALCVLVPLLSLGCTDEATPEERDYLAAFCGALDGFSDRLAAADTETAIAAAIEGLFDDLDSLAAPTSLQGFHESFVAYVGAVAASPERLVNEPVPTPPADVRDRLKTVEREIDACDRASPFETAP